MLAFLFAGIPFIVDKRLISICLFSSGLDKFDFVFMILLRFIDKASSLTQLIINQHVYLEDIDPDFITFILKGKNNHRVLLLLDGYDEYTPGTNKDIDKVINQGVGKSFIVLTSRPGFLDKNLKDKYNGNIIIQGLNNENIKFCSSKYLQSEEKSDKLLKQAKAAGIGDLLKVPIILLMTSMVYEERQMLPRKKTELVKTIVEMCVKRATLKFFSRKSYDVDSIQMLLLGKFSWQSLQNDVRQLAINKVS